MERRGERSAGEMEVEAREPLKESAAEGVAEGGVES